MRMGRSALAACAIVWAWAPIATAQGRIIPLAEVLTRAREQAPQIVSARLAIDEARAAVLGAAIRLPANPELDAWIGNRDGPGDRFTDVELGVVQRLESGGRRAARLAAADAGVAMRTAEVDEVTRLVLRQAAVAYYRAAHAGARLTLLTDALALATRVYEAADRRFKAGDIAVLDVNVARAALARVRADRESAEAQRAAAIGELRVLVPLEPDVRVDVGLPAPLPGDLATAQAAASSRPELRILDAAIRNAEAERRAGQSAAKPEYGVGVRYSRDEGEHVILGGLTVTLPWMVKGQEQLAAGSARAARLRRERDAAAARIDVEIRTAHEVYARRLSAVRILDDEARPGLDENAQLTTRSFEAGQIGLPELLLLRRETLDTRMQYLDALLEAALARVDLDASAGTLR